MMNVKGGSWACPEASLRPGRDRKLAGMVSAPTSPLWRVAAHPLGTSICLALGYMVLCTVYVALTGWLPARAGLSFEHWLAVELRRGLVFALSTGAAYFGFAWFLLRRIAAQQNNIC